MLNFLLNKGGAGVSLSRQQTTEHLNPLLVSISELIHAYSRLVQTSSNADFVARIEEQLRNARLDAARLSETVLSAGGAPFRGTSSEIHLELDESNLPDAIAEKERAFFDALKKELKEKHHVRTQAVLTSVHTNSQARLNLLKEQSRQKTRV